MRSKSSCGRVTTTTWKRGDQPSAGKQTHWNTERTLEVFPDPLLVYTLWQNDDSALNVPRDDDLSGCDAKVLRSFLDLGERNVGLKPQAQSWSRTIGNSRVSLTCLLLPSGE